mgnify:FL=1
MESTSSIPARPWPAWQCFLFRFALLSFLLYAFPSPISLVLGTIAELGTVLGADVEKQWPWRVASWLGQSINLEKPWQALTSWMYAKGLAPYEVIHQRTGSGDSGHEIARHIAIVVLAGVGALAWTAIASRRARAAGSATRGYPRLGRWLHLAVRLDLAFTMITYGSIKLYGGQFGQLSLMRLTQEIGDTAPMSMVGTFMQASKPYEIFGGLGELLGGLLLFSRHTALLGACVSMGVMANVCAINWLCGVPVKLFSAYLILCAIGLLAPWANRLWALFVSNQPSAPVDMRLPVSARTGRWLFGLGCLWIGVALLTTHLQGRAPKPWEKGRERSEVYGLWRVEKMVLDGVEVPAGDASRWRDFAVDAGTTAWAREYSGERRFFDFQWDPASGTAQVKARDAGDQVTAERWTSERGEKTVKVGVPWLLRPEDIGRLVGEPLDIRHRRPRDPGARIDRSRAGSGAPIVLSNRDGR